MQSSLTPTDATALAALSWLSMCEGDTHGALERAEHAISAAPNDAIAWLAKARILQFSGRPKDACIAYLTALRLNPVGPDNWIILAGLIISHYFERDYNAVVEVAQRAIRDHPQFVSPYRWLAAALGQLGRSDAAPDALSKAIEVSPESFDFYVSAGRPGFDLKTTNTCWMVCAKQAGRAEADPCPGNGKRRFPRADQRILGGRDHLTSERSGTRARGRTALSEQEYLEQVGHRYIERCGEWPDQQWIEQCGMTRTG